MNTDRPTWTLKATLIAIASVCLTCAMIGGLQPLFDNVFAGGTLLASNASAEEPNLPSGDDFAPRTNPPEGANVPPSDPSTLDVFENDPLSSLALALQQRQGELRAQSAELEAKEEKLRLLEKEIEERFKRLEKERSNLKAERGSFEKLQAAQRSKEFKKWRDILKASPQIAPGVLEMLDPRMARQIVASLDIKDAKKLVNALPPDQATTLVGTGLKEGEQ